MTFKKFIKNEIEGWKKLEVTWLLIACAVIVGLSIYWDDTVMGIISSTTGVVCVVCTGKGKLSAYIFGLVNTVLYAVISYKAALYGETMLNALYYVPMQFVGFYVWSRHMNDETHEVRKKHMKAVGRIFMVLAVALGTFLYGLLLKRLGDAICGCVYNGFIGCGDGCICKNVRGAVVDMDCGRCVYNIYVGTKLCEWQ